MNCKLSAYTIAVIISSITILSSVAMDSHSTSPDSFVTIHKKFTEACQLGNAQAVTEFIGYFKATGIWNKILKTQPRPIDTACLHGHVQIYEILLENGASLDWPDNKYPGPIECAFNSQNKYLAKRVFVDVNRHNKDYIGQSTSIDLTLMWLSLAEEIDLEKNFFEVMNTGNIQKMNDFMKKVPDQIKFINTILTSGSTPLIFAILNSSKDVVIFLINHGADTNLEDIKKLTPLKAAVIISRNPKLTMQSSELAELLIKHGASIDSKDEHGNSMLLISCALGHFEMVKILIEHGANVNFNGLRNNTPLHAASKGEIASYLLSNGANIESVDDTLKTPLHIACLEGNLELVKVLIENGANVHAETSDGLTPLDLLEKTTNKKDKKEIECLLNKKGLVQISDAQAKENMLNFIAELEQEQSEKKDAREKKAAKNRKKKQRRKQKKNEEKDSASQNATPKNDDETIDTNNNEIENTDLDSLADTLSITSLAVTPTPSSSSESSASSSTQLVVHSTSSSSSSTSAAPISTAANKNSSLNSTTVQNSSSSSSTSITNISSSTSQPPAFSPAHAPSQKAQISNSSRPYQVLVDKKNFTWPKSLHGNQEDNLREHLLKLRNWPNHGCDVKSMKNKPNLYRLRVGGYRAIFEVDTLNKQIRVLSLNLRKVAYRGLDFKS